MDKTIDLGVSVNNLHSKLSVMRSECNAKDDLVSKHAKVAEEAIAGWEKAEAETLFLKQELDEALRQRIAAEERIADLDAALKECMQQLHFNQEEQEQRINNAVMHICREHEQEWALLEEKMGETSKMLAKLDFEKSHLSKTLQTKEKLIEDLRKCKSQVEAKFNKLLERVETEEKNNLRSADSSHKQHTDSMKKIIMLEKECQRLRHLLQKRLPGPATLAERKNEVLRKEADEFNRQNVGLMVKNITSHDSPSKRINFLIEKLCSMEEENRTLKESITKKNNEIQILRTMGTDTTSNIWNLSKAQIPTESARSASFSHDLSRTSFSESGHEDEISCAESWASALITELEHFTTRKSKDTSASKTVGVSGMDLMDDFVEMEKLATLSTDKTFESSDAPSHESNACMQLLGSGLGAQTSETPGKELVPDKLSGSSANVSPSDTNTQKIQSDVRKSICRIIELIELIDQPSSMDYGSSTLSEDNGSSLAYKDSISSTGYTVRVFQWKSSELHAVLQKLAQRCHDLINGKAVMDDFPIELGVALEWTFNHCFSIQDVSRMRDTVKKHFDCDDSESESELGNVNGCQQQDAERAQESKEQLYPHSFSGLKGCTNFSKMDEVKLNQIEENTMLKQKLANLETLLKDLEGKLQSSSEKIEELLIQLRDLEERDLQSKVEPKGMLENETDNPKCLRDDLDSELSIVRNELNVACQNSFSLELELENKINRCQELETTCIELQLQLDSVTKGEVQKYDTEKVEGQLQSEWEITAASEKLAECQETILNLGKQLKALSSPKQTASLDKVVSTSPATAARSNNANHRSLLDQMLSEDNANFEAYKSPTTKDIACTTDTLNSVAYPSDIPSQVMSHERVPSSNETKCKDKAGTGQAMAIIPSNKCGGVSLLRKMISRRKRESGKSLTMVT